MTARVPFCRQSKSRFPLCVCWYCGCLPEAGGRDASLRLSLKIGAEVRPCRYRYVAGVRSKNKAKFIVHTLYLSVCISSLSVSRQTKFSFFLLGRRNFPIFFPIFTIPMKLSTMLCLAFASGKLFANLWKAEDQGSPARTPSLGVSEELSDLVDIETVPSPLRRLLSTIFFGFLDRV